MRHKNTVELDTCSCIIDIFFDDALPTEEVVYEYELVRACPFHTTAADALDECKTKNVVIGEIVSKNPDIMETVIDNDGNESRRFKKNAKPRFRYDETRRLIITVPTLNAKAKSDAAVEIEKKRGELKNEVIIE